MSNRDILLIFDIDETLLQFINKKSYHFWEETSDEEKQIITDGLEYIDIPKKKQIIFFRPKLREFLKLVQSNPRIKIALWTYSEREYAEDIANNISQYFHFPNL